MSAPGTSAPAAFDPKDHRACGAVCLARVYKQLGQDVPEAEIWPKIAKMNRRGSVASTTHLMAKDALERGFHAVILQVKYPIQALRRASEAGVHVILNHRNAADSPLGHYGILRAVDDDAVTLTDPNAGERRLSHAELLALWEQRFPNAEILGNVLIAISAKPSDLVACSLCRTPLPAEVACPRCQQPVHLQPTDMLGCVSASCVVRSWSLVACPACDHTWTFDLDARSASVASMAAVAAAAARNAVQAPTADPWNLAPMFKQLDEFCAKLMSIPQVAKHPDVQQQLARINEERGKFIQAQTQQIAQSQQFQAHYAKLQTAAKERMAAFQQRMAEAGAEPQPLDPKALSQALLKNLGLAQ